MPKQVQSTSVVTQLLQKPSITPVQMVGTQTTPSVTTIPVITSIPNQQPQHAGTLILPGGRAVSVQSVPVQPANTNVKSPLSVQTPVCMDTGQGTKGMYYLSPDSSGNLQLLPATSQTKCTVSPPSITTTPAQKTLPLVTICSTTSSVKQASLSYAASVTYPNQETNGSEKIVADSNEPLHQGKESNNLLELSHEAEPQGSYLSPQVSSPELTLSPKGTNTTSVPSTSTIVNKPNASVHVEPVVATEDIRALVKFINDSHHDVITVTSPGDKENHNLISAGKDYFGKNFHCNVDSLTYTRKCVHQNIIYTHHPSVCIVSFQYKCICACDGNNWHTHLGWNYLNVCTPSSWIG